MKKWNVKLVLILCMTLFLLQLPTAVMAGTQTVPANNEIIFTSQQATISIDVLEATPDLLKVESIVDCNPISHLNYFVINIYLQIWKRYTVNGQIARELVGGNVALTPIGENHIYRVTAEKESPEVDVLDYQIVTRCNYILNGQYKWVTTELYTHIEVEETPETLLIELIQMINASSDECWRNPAENRKATMIEKIDEVFTFYNTENYEEAYDKTLHDLKPKLTGVKADESGEPYGNGEFKNAWVICPNLQAEFEDIINELLTQLKHVVIPII